MEYLLFILLMIACSFGSSYILMDFKYKKEFSKNNVININCFTTKQDEQGNFPEIKFITKDLEEALAIKKQYEKLGWIVILTATTKTKGIKNAEV